MKYECLRCLRLRLARLWVMVTVCIKSYLKFYCIQFQPCDFGTDLMRSVRNDLVTLWLRHRVSDKHAACRTFYTCKYSIHLVTDLQQGVSSLLFSLWSLKWQGKLEVNPHIRTSRQHVILGQNPPFFKIDDMPTHVPAQLVISASKNYFI